jgi:uncharacterized protein YkwD
MRRFPMVVATAALLGILLGCQSESTEKRGEGPEPTFPFTVRSTEPTRRATQPVLKGVASSPVPVNTAPKIAPQPQPPPGPPDAQFDTNLVRMLNKLRGDKNQQPLSFNPILTRAAQAQAKLLTKGKQLDLNAASAQVKEGGYKLGPFFVYSSAARELNAAAFYPMLAQNDFILKPEYRDIGIGIDADANNNYHIAILFAGEQK